MNEAYELAKSQRRNDKGDLDRCEHRIGKDDAHCQRRQMLEKSLDYAVRYFFDSAPQSNITFSDRCTLQNEFVEFDFADAGDLAQWTRELAYDRGPLSVSTVNGKEIAKCGAALPDEREWFTDLVAIVRTGNDSGTVLFVVMIGADITGATIRKVKFSTDNAIWNLNFESPLRREYDAKTDSKPIANVCHVQNHSDNIRPASSSRARRANDLARAIEDWAVQKTARSFRVAVWGIGVDAVFGNAIFVPVEFADDGRVTTIGHVGKSGRKLYLCDVDLPSEGAQGCQAYVEMALMDFIGTVLDDATAMGVSIRLGDNRLLVARKFLAELVEKINGLSPQESDG